MPIRSFCRLLGALLLAAALLPASTLFDFNSLTAGTETTFNYTVGGVTATFSASCAFSVEPYSAYDEPPLVSGNDLLDDQSASPCTLRVR